MKSDAEPHDSELPMGEPAGVILKDCSDVVINGLVVDDAPGGIRLTDSSVEIANVAMTRVRSPIVVEGASDVTVRGLVADRGDEKQRQGRDSTGDAPSRRRRLFAVPELPWKREL
jgi:hypothetical protein